MDLLYVALFSVTSLIVLFLLTKLTGNRQISEMTMFDHITSITIGSIAAEMATNLENFERPLLAMVIYGVVSFLISVLCSKSIVTRRYLFGRSRILYKNGTLFRENFKKSRIDINEFLMQCRTAGYFDLDELDCVVFEPSGKMSFLPKAQTKPLTAEDMKIVPKPNVLTAAIIIDGNIMHKNLAAFGRDENWLKNEMKTQGVSLTAVFLGTLTEDGTANFYTTKSISKNDIYE